jgi:vacuolar-type H+-ATPase subunit H
MAKTKTKKMREQASELSDRIAPTVESAREKVGPLVNEAREKTAPLIAEAREKAGTATSEARDVLTSEVLPVLTAAVAAAGAATEDVRGETKKRGKAVAAALKGEVEPPKKSHKLRNLLVLLGLGGIAAFVAKKISNREPTTAWQSSYTPTPAAGATGGAHKADEAADADDQGGASPDVAAADAAAAPHEATTPDNPAETIDVSKK